MKLAVFLIALLCISSVFASSSSSDEYVQSEDMSEEQRIEMLAELIHQQKQAAAAQQEDQDFESEAVESSDGSDASESDEEVEYQPIQQVQDQDQDYFWGRSRSSTPSYRSYRSSRPAPAPAPTRRCGFWGCPSPSPSRPPYSAPYRPPYRAPSTPAGRVGDAGQPCKYSQPGTCGRRSACSGTLKSGYCNGGSDNVCCVPRASTPYRPPYRAPAPTPRVGDAGQPCKYSQPGTCGRRSACSGTLKSGYCNGGSDNVCCVPRTSSPTRPSRPSSSGTDYAREEPIIPNTYGVTYLRQSTAKRVMGIPGSMTRDCSSLTNSKLRGMQQTVSIDHIRVTGIRPALALLRAALADVKRQYPDLYRRLSTAGMLCCRAVRGSTTSFSNHSWGSAIDFKIDGRLDPRKNAKAQHGLNLMAPIFARHGWFWGGWYSARYEDAMHFEVSNEQVNRWGSDGTF